MNQICKSKEIKRLETTKIFLRNINVLKIIYHK